jgi:CRISPR/Cas system-associated endonuclease Cas1
MKTVIIDKLDEKVEIKGSKIFTKNQTIPIKLIDMLILTESVDITPKNIINISNENIPLLYLSKDSKKFSLTLPLISKNSELKVIQYKALAYNIDIAKRLIYEKFISHQKSLDKFGIVIDITDELSSLALADSIDTKYLQQIKLL